MDEVDWKIEQYARAEVELNREQAMDEIAADYAGELVEDHDLLQDFARRADRNVVQRFLDALKEMVEKLTGRQRTQTEEAIRLLEVAVTAAEKNKNAVGVDGGVRYSFNGYDEETGRGIYQGNFPKGTPKKVKGERILNLIQNVWSKNPIELVVRNDDGTSRTILAQFDPTYSTEENVLTDASKLMGGNRHGTSSEQRVTLDLADDYHQILTDATHNYSKLETGKDKATHNGVNEWHYFVNDILFQEYDENKTVPYTVTIDVKERDDGSFVYSFHAERQKENQGTRRTLHADVNHDENVMANALISDDNVPQSGDGVKRYSLKGADDYRRYSEKYARNTAENAQNVGQAGQDVGQTGQNIGQVGQNVGQNAGRDLDARILPQSASLTAPSRREPVGGETDDRALRERVREACILYAPAFFAGSVCLAKRGSAGYNTVTF